MAGRLSFSGARRLPVVRQTEVAECGLACLAMIASYFGLKTNLNSLRLQYRASLKGATLKNIIAIADKLGMSARPLRLEPDSMHRLKTPCILHWGMNHFVVLRESKGDSCLVHDPALGERRYRLNEVSAKFTGIALELTPTPAFAPRDDRRRMRLSDLWGKVTGLKTAIVQTLILSLIVQLFALAAPFYMQLVVDEVLTSFDTNLLAVLALGFGLFMIINQAANAMRACVILYTGNMLGFQVVSNLFRHLLRLPTNWYEKRHVGDILSRFASTRPIRDLLAGGLVAALIDGLMAASTLVLIFVYSPALGSVVVLVAILYTLLRLLLYRSLRQKTEQQLISGAGEQSAFIESVRGIQSIKVFSHEAERHSLWQNRYAEVVNCSVSVGKLRIGFDTANGLLFGIENTVVVYLGATCVIDGSLTIGMLFAFMAYKRHFVEKVGMLVERYIEFRLLDLHLDRIADIALAPADYDGSGERRGARLSDGGASGPRPIEIRDLSFRYADGEPWLLDNASLRINPGEMISIVGPSGGGKTTLMKLLLGLLDPDRGQVLYDGLPIRKYGLSAFRRNVGTVMQNDALLTGSIADNIAFFDPDPDFRKIREAADKAAIHTDITGMPMGYDSLVGDMGCALSAGQQQRVLLARALYRDPAILLLDEGTANLDGATEARIVRMLKRMDATCICIAHRERMIMASDRVVLLQSGSLHELDRRQVFAPHRQEKTRSE